MSSMKNERGGRKMTKGRKDASPVEETCTDGSVGGDGALKKGPWTAGEDAILLDYVTKHGEGNWNAVQKHSGLFRCGKSCRLRWANHLRPDLKKGAFTPDEERRIIELHAKMGNKWARMAVELPGRTDNEIKNYWNTRTKRLQRAGLPIYPPDVCLQAWNGTQESLNMGTLEAGDMHHTDPLEVDRYEIPDVEFKNLELDRGILSYTPPFVDIHASSILKQRVSTAHNISLMFPTMHPPKRPREPEMMFPCVDGSGNGSFPLCDQQHERISGPFGSSPFEPDLNSNHQLQFGGFSGSHALINGNSSSSEPISSRAMKSELPSLQYSETQQGSWDMLGSLLSSFESVDTLIQYPPTEQAQADCVSPRSTGLLEAILYESQALKRAKKSPSHTMPDDAVSSLSVKVKPCEQDWEVNGDPNSPLAHSTASVFSEYTPISRSSSGESPLAEMVPGCDVKPEATVLHVGEREYPKMDYSRPDALLDSCWFGHGKENSILADSFGPLLGDDYFSDY